MTRLLLLAVLLPLTSLGCDDNLSCKKCKVPLYDGFTHDADDQVKSVIFANQGRAAFSTPIFTQSTDNNGCMLLHAQCFKEIGDAGTNNLHDPPGNIIDVVIPPIVPIEQPNPTLTPLRIRRQIQEDHLFNYFIWTDQGKNHSLQSYWTHQRGDINHATFRCNDKAQWTYEYSNKTVAQVTGLYCFWIARDLTQQAIGYRVGQPLASPVLNV